VKHLESVEQRLFIQWVRLQYSDLLACAVPNGGRRNPREAAILKREGVTRGVPDWLCFERSGTGKSTAAPYVGLALEFKSPTGKGRVSPEQQRWISGLRVKGWRVEVVTSAQQAADVLRVYLDGSIYER
jgi:hypothetical protein